MKTTRWQFSLRQLLVVISVFAIVLTLLSHHWRIVVGFVTVALALLEAFFPFVEMFAALLDPRALRKRKPTEREINEFAARYPKRPQTTMDPGKPSDS